MACLKDTEVSALYTLEETIAKDIFEGVTYPWEVLKKISDFIVALGNTLPEEIFDKVYTWVDGHTWYVQYLLNRLFALPEKTLSPELLDSLMMEILREEEYTYQTYFQLLTFNQIQLLKAIAKEGIVREVNAAAFIKKYDLKAVSSVNTSLRILIDKEFILRQPDGYIVYDRFMSIWLSRI